MARSEPAGSDSIAAAQELPPPSPLTDGFLAVFTVWTMLCNATALGGGGLRVLVSAAAGTLILAMIWALIRRRRIAGTGPNRLAPRTEDSPAVRRAFAVIVVSAVALTLIAHRPDLDDATFVNWAVTAADDPGAPLYQLDRKTSIPGVREVLPVRRAQSLEMLAAAIAWATGGEAITPMHLVFPPVAALLICLAHREILRLLAPRVWILGLAVAVVFLFLDGGLHRTWGNFAFVRLHQGKSILLTAMVPLVMASALRFMARPCGWSWLRLAAAQIASVGLSANGLWLAPAVAGLSLVSTATALRQGGRTTLIRLMAGASASVYLVFLGVYFRLRFEFPEHLTAVPGDGTALLKTSLGAVMTPGGFGWLTAALVLLAAVSGNSRSSVVFTRAYILLWALIFANPWIAPWIAANVTGTEVHWRVFWALPVAVFVALGAIAPLSTNGWIRSATWARAVTALLATSLLATGWGGHVLRPDNHTRIGWPGLKTDPEFATARRLRDLLGPETVMLGPNNVTAWVVTLRRHPIPLLARTYHGRLHGDEGARRRALKEHISGGPRLPGRDRALVSGLERHRVEAVCLPASARRASEDREVLIAAGFRRIETIHTLEVWIRDGTDPEALNVAEAAER
jgi:hypothetical protein